MVAILMKKTIKEKLSPVVLQKFYRTDGSSEI